MPIFFVILTKACPKLLMAEPYTLCIGIEPFLHQARFIFGICKDKSCPPLDESILCCFCMKGEHPNCRAINPKQWCRAKRWGRFHLICCVDEYFENGCLTSTLRGRAVSLSVEAWYGFHVLKWLSAEHPHSIGWQGREQGGSAHASAMHELKIPLFPVHPVDMFLSDDITKHSHPIGWCRGEQESRTCGNISSILFSLMANGATCPGTDKLPSGHKGGKGWGREQGSWGGKRRGEVREIAELATQHWLQSTLCCTHIKIMFSLLCSCKGKISCDLKDLYWEHSDFGF